MYRATEPTRHARVSILAIVIVLDCCGFESADRTLVENGCASWREARRIEAHANTVAALAFTVDGKRAASASYDKTVRLWDARSWALVRAFSGHAQPVTSVALSPDGSLMAGGSQEPSVRVRRVVDGDPLFPASAVGQLGKVSGIVAISPDGNVFATNADCGAVRLWRVSDGQPVRTLEPHRPHTLCLAFSPDGKSLATGGADGTVRLWSVRDGALVRVLGDRSGRVRKVAFGRDGETLAAGGEGETIIIWRTAGWKLLQNFRCGSVVDFAFSPDADIVAVCTTSDSRPTASLHLWRVSDGTQVQVLVRELTEAHCVAFSPDGKLLAAGCTDGTIRLFSPGKK